MNVEKMLELAQQELDVSNTLYDKERADYAIQRSIAYSLMSLAKSLHQINMHGVDVTTEAGR